MCSSGGSLVVVDDFRHGKSPGMILGMAGTSKRFRKGMAEVGWLRETGTGALAVWRWGWQRAGHGYLTNAALLPTTDITSEIVPA